MKLNGRTCYFAGATGNIGRGAVKALASHGMNVIMATHDPERASDIISACAGMEGTVTAVSNQLPLEKVLQQAAERFGSVDVYINTTGSLSVPKPFGEFSEEETMQKLSHHIAGPLLELQTFLPYLKQSRHPRIILCSSAGASSGILQENMLDSIARGGVISMTYCLARELMQYGITVNCIARSGMVNDHDDHSPATLDASVILPEIPMKRNGTPEEFGALAAYLASEESALITVQIFHLDGCLTIGK